MQKKSSYVTVKELNHYVELAKKYNVKDFSISMVECKSPQDTPTNNLDKMMDKIQSKK